MHDMTYSELQSIAAESAGAVPMDEDEFRAFYDRTARIAWAYLSRLTGDQELHDEGHVDEASGELREGVGKVKRGVGDAIENVGERIKR